MSTFWTHVKDSFYNTMQLPGLAQPMELKGKAETQVHFPVSPTRAVVGGNDGETGTAVTR